MFLFWTLYIFIVIERLCDSIWGIPLFVMRQVTALAKMGNPDKNFKHTEHNRSVNIDELVVQEPEHVNS